MRLGVILAAILVSALLVHDLSAQGPPPPPMPPMPQGQGRDPAQQAPQKTGTARLSGRVTALDTGRPIRRAVVRLTAPELRDGRSVSTDADGRWELRDLPAGRYALMVTKGGYVNLQYGQLRPFESGKTIELGDGQALEKLDVALPRGGAITGRVLDEFGEPVANARVGALRHRFVQGQRRLFAVGAGDSTDDLGTFRLHGLPPGDYLVSAQPNVFTFLGTSEDRTGYSQTYFPGTLDPSQAQRITVGIGQEVSNLVIPLTPTRVAIVSGTATTSEGKPVTMGSLFARPVGAGEMGILTPAIVRDGTWTLSNVAPGSYQLVLQYNPATFGGSAGGTEMASLELTVAGEDITGIALVTSPGGIARGRIRFEGANPPATIPSGVFIQGVVPDDPMAFSVSSTQARPDGTFEIRGLLGRRIIRATPPPGWVLKAVTYEGTDITDTGVDVAADQELAGFEIVFTQDAPELSGTVQNAKGAAVGDYVVVLFAPEREKWGWQTRFVRVARPDQTGRFTIRGVVPGSYLAVALEYLEPGEEGNPEFLESVRSLGAAVRVADGEKKQITLKLSAQ
ncbi:MAG TPA: carboxypeptidase-like regulatory domain-containing protein [Vicinamibacterales bacterium]|nr:carboxypeptidase-like regulatory domain-containing protein [Vicinamibacterales bacterium]